MGVGWRVGLMATDLAKNSEVQVEFSERPKGLIRYIWRVIENDTPRMSNGSK